MMMVPELEIIQNTPIIRLTPAELRKLPEDDLARALSILFDMAKECDLTMVQHNPPGTTYRVDWNRDRGWCLEPVCRCHNEPRFIEAYYEYRGEEH